MVFLGGSGGGRENDRSRSAGSVFAGRRALLNSPIKICYILYMTSHIEQWGFRISDHRAPDPRCPGQTSALFKFRQPDDLCHTLKTVKARGCCTSFRHGLHGAVGMVSYTHVVYVTCYLCYIFSLEPSSGSIASFRIYRSDM
jgi:hypothetical protein